MNVAEAINIFTTLIKVGLLTLCGLFALVKTTNKADAGLTPKADTVRHLLLLRQLNIDKNKTAQISS